MRVACGLTASTPPARGRIEIPDLQVISTAQKARAVETAARVAARLRAPHAVAGACQSMSRQTSFPTANAWRAGSLALGASGLALLFHELAKANSDEEWRIDAHTFMESALRDSLRTSRLGLFEGAVGAASVLELMRGADGAYSGISRRMGLHITARLDMATRAVDARLLQGGDNRPTDVGHACELLAGVSGWLAYPSVAIDTESVRHLRIEFRETLLGQLAFDPGPRAFTTFQRSDPAGPSAPHGWVDIGMAHGISGIVSMLAIDRIAHANLDPRCDSALEGAARWLIQVAQGEPTRPTWGRGAILDSNGYPNGSIAARPGWCYGTAGVARALFLIGRAIRSPSMQNLAVEALLAALVQIDQLRSPGLCHGVAGFMLVCYCMAQDTHDRRLVKGVDDTLNRLLALQDTAWPLWYQDVEVTGSRVDNPGFLSGASGVALALLAVASDTTPRWLTLLALA